MFEKIVDEAPDQVQEAANTLLSQAKQHGGGVRYVRNDQDQDAWVLYNNAARWAEQRGKGRVVNGNFKSFEFHAV